jgi:ribonuclease HII
MIIAGIDEAGRGPVIGPMVMAVCATEEENLKSLEELGVKDSKLLSPQRREFLFDKIKELCKYHIIILSPQEIDAALNDRSVNLNRLEAKTTADLVKKIDANKIIIDCPSNNIKAYKDLLVTLVGASSKELVVEHRADTNNVIVGAASILAKVTRDGELEKLRKKVGIDFGSGYPADPKTVEFLKENWHKYDFFRKSWATYKKLSHPSTNRTLENF